MLGSHPGQLRWAATLGGHAGGQRLGATLGRQSLRQLSERQTAMLGSHAGGPNWGATLGGMLAGNAGRQLFERQTPKNAIPIQVGRTPYASHVWGMKNTCGIF